MTLTASRLIGRQQACDRLEAMLVPGALVTLTGPGGVGKTRLAEELAALVEVRTGQPVPVGLLSELATDAGADAVADALGFESVSAAVVVLTERPGTIVLDNCEHVLAAVRQLVAAVRSAVPSIAVLTTTREPLGLMGEQVFVVDPLELPAPGGADAERAPAVELFLERAAAAGAVLGDDPHLVADVAELCRRLDGLPLAIELAAARTRALAPADLLEVVDQRLDVLRRTRHVGDRHDTMRAAIEVSTAVLPPDDRAFFRRLGMFTGPFDLGLAHAVAGEPGADRVRLHGPARHARRAVAGDRRVLRSDDPLPAARAAPRARPRRAARGRRAGRHRGALRRRDAGRRRRLRRRRLRALGAGAAGRGQQAVHEPRPGLRAVPRP